MTNIFIYRFEFEDYDEFEQEVMKTKGFIAATSYKDAAERIEKICTAPNGKCDLISLSLYEVDSWNGMGILTDDDINEIKGGK